MSATSNEKTFMQKFWWVIVLVVLAIPVIMVIGTYNGMIRDENSITAENDKIENEIGAGYRKFQSSNQVANKVGEIYLQAIREGNSGRYGKDGVQGAMIWIKETYPELDATVFKAVQAQIEITFNRIETTQTAKRDKIRVYENRLETFPSNIVASMFGFPRINLEELKQMISSDEAKKAMEDKRLPVPQL